MSDGAPDFSFSGIKTAVSLHVRAPRPARTRRRWPTSPRRSRRRVVTLLVRKTVRAASRLCVRRVVLTGGVAANGALRDGARRASAPSAAASSSVPSRALCTDNAAMIAAAGHDRLVAGERASLELNAVPDLALA